MTNDNVNEKSSCIESCATSNGAISNMQHVHYHLTEINSYNVPNSVRYSKRVWYDRTINIDLPGILVKRFWIFRWSVTWKDDQGAVF